MPTTEKTEPLPSDLFSSLATRAPHPDRAGRGRYEQVQADLRVVRIHPSI
jgi:hypothetical protein